MVLVYHKNFNRQTNVFGGGLINRVINKLPFELHLPGYQFCGPGTKLQARLQRGEKGINPLDAACREHDIAYSKNKDLHSRHQADKILENRAWERVLDKDTSIGERANAYLVTNAMKAKVKFGMGIRKKKCNGGGTKHFTTAVRTAANIIKKKKPQDMTSAIRIVRKSIQNSLKGKKSQTTIPRIINVPKNGGILPLLPIFAALGALGSLAGGGAAIAKTVISTKNARTKLEEDKRHNKAMEALAVGKGLYLKPYKKGYGLVCGGSSKNY